MSDPTTGEPGAPWSTPAGYAEPRPPLSGALIIVALLNILFALGCGWGTGAWTYIASIASADNLESVMPREEVVRELDDRLLETRDAALARVQNPEQRARLERTYDLYRRHGLSEAFYDAMVATAGTAPMRSLKTLGTVAIVLLVALLVASVMMLFRFRISRPLCMLACAGIIVVNAMAATQFIEAGSIAFDATLPVIEEIAAEAGLDVDPSIDQEILDIPEKFRTFCVGGSVFYAILAAAWPLLALLLLAFSRGIKESLGLEEPMAAPGFHS